MTLSAVTILAFAGWAWGMRKILYILDKVTTKLDPSMSRELELDRFFRYWRVLLLFVIIGTIVVGLLFVGGMLLILTT